MSTRLTTLCFDANDPLRLARLWESALDWDVHAEGPDEIGLLPTDGTRFVLLFLPVPDRKSEKNRIHLDLVSESPAHQAEMMDRLRSLGAQDVDIGQAEDAVHVLADPEGNEFCVVVRGEFLATTGLLGAVVFEPAHPRVGYFWSKATGWPIVYDKTATLLSVHPTVEAPSSPSALQPRPPRRARNESTSTSHRHRMVTRNRKSSD